jgi:hypothetical protein
MQEELTHSLRLRLSVVNVNKIATHSRGESAGILRQARDRRPCSRWSLLQASDDSDGPECVYKRQAARLADCRHRHHHGLHSVGDPVPGENLRKLAVIVTVMSILA